jgi:hypothetical protein
MYVPTKIEFRDAI